MPSQGRSLELYYIEGRPDGMLTAEMFNWTGHVLMAPRTQLPAALARREAGYTGVYILIGERAETPLAYVGESEDIGQRIKSHDLSKDWWTSVVLVASAGNKLNKAHARYLEARLIEEARKVGRIPLENGNAPSLPSLSEADVANMEAFLENLLIVLPAVRVDMFLQGVRAKPPVGPAPTVGPTGPVRFFIEAPKHRLKATAVLVDGELIVEAGSLARLNWEGATDSPYAKLYEELRRAGVLEPADNHCIFRKNYAFRSPSAAAAIVKGRNSNGPENWKVEGDGRSYKEWEAQQLRS